MQLIAADGLDDRRTECIKQPSIFYKTIFFKL